MRGTGLGGALGAMTVLAVVVAAGVYGAVKKVSTIELRGLQYLSKGEIMSGVSMARTEGSISVDVSALERNLRTHPMVVSYSMTERGDSLVVSVVENRPRYIIALSDNNRTVPYELDGSMRVISANRVHALDAPVIVAAAGEMRNGVISGRLARTLAALKEAGDAGLAVVREIEEVNVKGATAVVVLRGRRTRFYMNIDGKGLRSLNCLAGYMDRSGVRPARAVHYGDFAILK